MSVFPFALRLTCYCWIAYFIFLDLTSHALPEQQYSSNYYRYLGENAPAHSPIIKDVDLFINGDEDDDEELFGDDLDDEYINVTEVAGTNLQIFSNILYFFAQKMRFCHIVY